MDLHIRREQRWFEVLRFLMQNEPADLVGVLFDGVDKLQHLCWRFIDPELRPLYADRSSGSPQQSIARNAVASTFGLSGEEYAPEVET